MRKKLIIVALIVLGIGLSWVVLRPVTRTAFTLTTTELEDSIRKEYALRGYEVVEVSIIERGDHQMEGSISYKSSGNLATAKCTAERTATARYQWSCKQKEAATTPPPEPVEQLLSESDRQANLDEALSNSPSSVTAADAKGVETAIRNKFRSGGVEVVDVSMAQQADEQLRGSVLYRSSGSIRKSSCSAERSGATTFSWSCKPDLLSPFTPAVSQSSLASKADQQPSDERQASDAAGRRSAGSEADCSRS
jgi:hypothetical protein